MCVYTDFQQAAKKGPLKRREWAKRKKSLMALFSGNVKVKTHSCIYAV